MDSLQFNRRSSLDHSFNDNEDERHDAEQRQQQRSGFSSLYTDSLAMDDDQGLFSRDPFSTGRDHANHKYEPKMDSCFIGDAMSPSRTSLSGHFGAAESSFQPCQDNFLRGTEYEIFDQVDKNLSAQGSRLFDSGMQGPNLEQTRGLHGPTDALESSPLIGHHQPVSSFLLSNSGDELSTKPLSSQKSQLGARSHYSISRGESNTTSLQGDLKMDESIYSMEQQHQHAKQAPFLAKIKKQSSEEEQALCSNGQGNSTFDYSADTFSRSNKNDDQLDSYSDEDDAVYIPFEYQGDGRKREAKRHKLQAIVAKDEIDIDRMLREFQNQNSKIIESEQALDELRTLKISKKELQSKRNRLTAQLSRDRQKLEMVFLKAMCVNYQRLLRRLDKKLSDGTTQPFCDSCHKNLDSTLQHHRKNLASPAQIALQGDLAATAQLTGANPIAAVPVIHKDRPVISQVDVTEKKRSKITKPNLGSSSGSQSHKKKSVSDKRKTKIEEKSNTGLITSATMLSVVGLLNYMGNGEVPVCDYSLLQTDSNQMPVDQFRVARVSEAKNDLSADASFDYDNGAEEQRNNEWSLEQDAVFNPSYDEYDYNGDLVPAKPETVNGILNRTKTNGITLEEAYIAYDMRESFLQRHASPLAMESDTTELSTKDFTTKSCNIWKSDDMSLYPEAGSCADSDDEDPTVNIYEERYDRIEQSTSSMFCPTANLVAPFKNRGSTALMQDTNGDGQHDVILEKDESGNTYLHLVMPATAVNFLNGSDGSSMFDFIGNNSTSMMDDDEEGSFGKDIFVELGCKVYEVNKVAYRGNKQAGAAGASVVLSQSAAL